MGLLDQIHIWWYCLASQSLFCSERILLVRRNWLHWDLLSCCKDELYWLILSLVAHFIWLVHLMDIKSSFLPGNMFEEIYMEHPPSFMIDSIIYFQLKKSLYGLKQAPRAWYEKIDQLFVSLGFKHCESNHSIYVFHVEGNTLIVVVYVDDLVLMRNKPNLIFRLKSWISNTSKMIDIGILHFFLGLQVLPLSNGLFISYSKYVLDLLKHFKMDDCKSCVMPF